MEYGSGKALLKSYLKPVLPEAAYSLGVQDSDVQVRSPTSQCTRARAPSALTHARITHPTAPHSAPQLPQNHRTAPRLPPPFPATIKYKHALHQTLRPSPPNRM